MIVKLRLEAEGTTLEEVLKDIDAATKAAKLPKELHVHDEHYERVHDTCFRGRRVFGGGPKAAPLNNPWNLPRYSQSLLGASGNTASNSVTVTPKAA